MKKLLSLTLLFVACSAFAIDSVVIQTTLKDNRVTSKTVKTTPVSEGVSKIVIKAKDIGKDCQYFDVLARQRISAKTANTLTFWPTTPLRKRASRAFGCATAACWATSTRTTADTLIQSNTYICRTLP